MLGIYADATIKYMTGALVAFCLLVGNNAFSSVIEYKADLFGPGMQVHNCIDLDSRGTIFGDFNESDGSLENVRGELKFVNILDGVIKRGFGNVKNYVIGSFKENAPDFLHGMNIFVDLSRGADYERTIVNTRKVREWGWALLYNPKDYSDDVDKLFDDRDILKTLRNPYKTFEQLCPKYANGNSAGNHGWCSAGVEFFANKGKETPAPVPLPAAFYLLSAGLIGLVSFSKKRNNS